MKKLNRLVFALVLIMATASIIMVLPSINHGSMIVEFIKDVCGDHPQDCRQGSLIASFFGRRFEYRSADGIVFDRNIFFSQEFSDGFSIYDPATGKHLQTVVYADCNCGADWEVFGYRPSEIGEHVFYESYSLYQLGCDNCGANWDAAYVSELAYVTYVEPVIAQAEIEMVVDDQKVGSYNSLDDVMQGSVIPEIEKITTR